MGKVEAKVDTVTRHDLRHDRHTVSLLTDHLVFSPKYRGKVLEGEVAEAAEEMIRKICKEMDIEVIDMAVNVDHVHLFIKNPFRKSVYGKMLRGPPKYSVSWIAKRIKGISRRELRQKFPHLKEWCPDHLWAPSCYHKTFKKSFTKNASQSVGHGWEVVERYIDGQKRYKGGVVVTVRGGIDRLRTFVRGM
ncbi:MAG TPA: IS200/IS605 family transposase [Desulfobacteria bacterium]|nr:IS200/IS605 family transposase [Desulfobacteria bacterium]